MTDWLTVPFFGDPVPRFVAVVRPSAYGIIPDGHGRLAVVRTPAGSYLPGGGQADSEAPELTVVREAREECGLAVRVGAWRRAAVEHVTSTAEQTHFEKRSTFCDAVVIAPLASATDPDHALVWVSPGEALEVLRPGSHRWAIEQWLRDGDRLSGVQAPRPAV
ncbi:MAG TPA: NUDIX domain-containing protein [Gemmatimonadales bacterium]